MSNKCSCGDMVIKPDGIHELDPCIYEDIEMYTNVTVIISRCQKCGHIEISWMKQDNTEEIPVQ
jgi:hypothetical protein